MVFALFRDMGYINKTILYFKRNGIKNTAYAVIERLQEKKKNPYVFTEESEEELERQREARFNHKPLISVLVPCYETKPVFLEDLILSLQDQTYTNFELVLADASVTPHVRRLAESYSEQYGNIVYHHLDSNEGISENTNQGLELCHGDYIGLLDHDDLLTKGALYHVVKTINDAKAKNVDPLLIYTDEDKTDTYLEHYYEPNLKTKLNEDLIMTNNYICHFSVYKSELIKGLRLRKEYDGAQDFDLVLRTIAFAKSEAGQNQVSKKDWMERIIHIPSVLYHWRCHNESTASNPASKNYAYDSGKRAIEDYVATQGWRAEVVPLKHLGFYRVAYGDGTFRQRKDIGVIGGPVIYKGKILSGILDGKGKALYGGLNSHFSGYLHRAVLQQSASVLDIRNMQIRPELEEVFEAETGYKFPLKVTEDMMTEDGNEEIIKKSIKFCNKVRNMDISLLYDPILHAKENE